MLFSKKDWISSDFLSKMKELKIEKSWRRPMKKNLSVFLVVFLQAFSFCFAQEMEENPVYKQWAKFKVGTMVKYKQESDMAGTKTEGEMTYTLVELTPEKAVVEMGMTTLMLGNKVEQPKAKMEHLAKLPKVDPKMAQEAKIPGAKVKESNEEIEVMGKKYKCHVLESTVDAGNGPMVTKVYSNDEIPGSLVKSITTIEKPMKTTTTITLVEKKIP